MPAVKARRRRSRGINWTSIVPAGCAGSPTAMVRVMARLREIPDPDAAADVRRVAAVDVERAQRTDEVAGDHEVVRFVDRDAVRIESVGREDVTGHACTNASSGVVLDHPPGLRAIRATHERHEKAAVAERGELVGDGCLRRIVRADERGMAWIGDVEEEDLILTAQHAEQAAERQRPPIAGEPDVVRLVADRAGSRPAGRCGGPCRRSANRGRSR